MTSEQPRRAFLRHSAALGVAALGAPALLAACTGDDTRPRREVAPPSVDPTAGLEVVVGRTRYGDAYVKAHERMYRQSYPGAKVSHTVVGEIDAKLRARFVAGDPPDVVDNWGAGRLNLGALVDQGSVDDLSDLLATPSVDAKDTTVGRSLLPGVLDSVTFAGRPYALPYVATAWGLWYDAKTFTDYQWQYPKTWTSLLELCEDIKRAGTMAPFVWPGKEPGYVRYLLHAMAFRIRGEDVWRAVDNLEPDAWRAGAIRQALGGWHQLVQRGFVASGASAMTAADARARWLQGKAAFLPYGSTLARDAKGKVPKDFQVTLAAPPSVTTGDKVPADALSVVPGEQYLVPTDAKNHAGGLEYLRLMCSRAGARTFAELTKAVSLVAGAHDDQDLGTAFTSTVEAIGRAGKVPLVPTPRYAEWYPSLGAEVDAALGALLAKKADPDAVVDRIQKRADAVAEDTDVVKRRR